MFALLIRLWTLPTTLPGLAAAGIARLTGGSVHCVEGVLEVTGGWPAHLLRRVGAAAMTLGDVVIARDEASQERCRPHERIHVRQARRWGPLFFPAYAVASLVAWLAGGHYYYDNRFEREAFGHETGQRKQKPQVYSLREGGRGQAPSGEQRDEAL